MSWVVATDSDDAVIHNCAIVIYPHWKAIWTRSWKQSVIGEKKGIGMQQQILMMDLVLIEFLLALFRQTHNALNRTQWMHQYFGYFSGDISVAKAFWFEQKRHAQTNYPYHTSQPQKISRTHSTLPTHSVHLFKSLA